MNDDKTNDAELAEAHGLLMSGEALREEFKLRWILEKGDLLRALQVLQETRELLLALQESGALSETGGVSMTPDGSGPTFDEGIGKLALRIDETLQAVKTRFERERRT